MSQKTMIEGPIVGESLGKTSWFWHWTQMIDLLFTIETKINLVHNTNLYRPQNPYMFSFQDIFLSYII